MPWMLIGRRVDVRSTAAIVQVFDEGESVKTHAALEPGKRTDAGDYPPEKIAFQIQTPMWCRSQASEVGDAFTGPLRALRPARPVVTGAAAVSVQPPPAGQPGPVRAGGRSAFSTGRLRWRCGCGGRGG
ncbi:hypothetical protein [Streptomyces sp. NPDC003032]